jgi:DNA-binding MarR family transcriptional regulator
LELARDILEHLETFLHVKTDGSWPHDFGSYLAALPDQDETHPPTSTDEPDTVALGVTLIALSNMVRRRASQALRNSPFTTIMDYQFLFVLRSHGPMSKGVLIEANGMESSSGTEVIKRILREGWIAEEPNPEDRRSVLVHLTRKGEAIETENREYVSGLYSSLSEPLDARHQSILLQLVHAIAAADSMNRPGFHGHLNV